VNASIKKNIINRQVWVFPDNIFPSDIAVDPICRTSLDSRCKEDPEKGEKSRVLDTGFCGTCRYFW